MMKERRYHSSETTIHLKDEIVFFREDMKPLTGCVYEAHENNSPKFEVNYKDGIPHGSFKEWYVSGLLKYEYNFKKGRLHGKLEMWNKDGCLIARQEYLNNKWSGGRYVNYSEGKRAYGFDHLVSYYFVDDEYTSGSEDELLMEHYDGSEIVSSRYRILNDLSKTDEPLIFGDKQELFRIPVSPDEENEEYIEGVEIVKYPIDCEEIESLHYKNGRLHGKQTYWREKNEDVNDGVFYKFCEENYLNGQMDGKQFQWQESGILIKEENFYKGKKNGKQLFWNFETGKLWCEENYLNGKLEGEQIEAHENWGNDILGYNFLYKNESLSNFQNGIKHGYERHWTDGKLISEENYWKGLLDGDQKYFNYDNLFGEIYHIKTYKKGVLMKVRASDEWGNPIDGIEENYKDGKRFGCFKNNNRETLFQNNIKDGLTRGWYDNRQLHFELPYKKDKLEGKCLLWYKSGRLKEEWNYKNGSLDGSFQVFYENGDKQAGGTFVDNVCVEIFYWDNLGNLAEPPKTFPKGLGSNFTKDFFEHTIHSPLYRHGHH